MDILAQKEYDFLKTDERLGNNVHLLGFGGSIAYGTNLPTSDIDIRGFATRSAKDILTSRDFETVCNTATDTTIYSLDKLVSLLAECNPNCIELLGLKPEHYLFVDEIGQDLLDHKEIFLSKRCVNTFGGYANQQLYRLRQKLCHDMTQEEYNAHIARVIAGMQNHLEQSYGLPKDTIIIEAGSEGLTANIKEVKGVDANILYDIVNEVSNVIRTYNKNSIRNDKAIAHNKIAKHAMHLIRLYEMGIELLEKGEINTYREHDWEVLLSIRQGGMPWFDENGTPTDMLWKLIEVKENQFNKAKENTKLPDKPDYEQIDKLLMRINTKVVLDNKE